MFKIRGPLDALTRYGRLDIEKKLIEDDSNRDSVTCTDTVNLVIKP
jgi:hypothetical protein